VHKKDFLFDLNENFEPSMFVVTLMGLHAELKDKEKPSTSTSK